MAAWHFASLLGALRFVICACAPCQCERKDRDCIYAPGGHVLSQDSIFRKLKRHWGTKSPRFLLDLGCALGQGIGHNYSDQLNFVEYFHAPGTMSWGVEANPFYARASLAKSKQAPWGTYPNVSLKVFWNAVGQEDDDELSLRTNGWEDCGIPGRLPWASPKPYIHVCSDVLRLAKKVGWPETTRRFSSPWTVSTRTVDSIWSKEARRRHIDFLKVDFDAAAMSAVLMSTLREITLARAFSVMVFELDDVAFAHGFSSGRSESNLADLLHFFELQGYVAFAKVPCYKTVPFSTLKDSEPIYLQPIRASFGARSSRMVNGFCDNFLTPQDLMLFDRRQQVLLDTVLDINRDCPSAPRKKQIVRAWGGVPPTPAPVLVPCPHRPTPTPAPPCPVPEPPGQFVQLAPLGVSFGVGSAFALGLGSLLFRRPAGPVVRHTALDATQCQYGAPAE